MTSYKHAFSYLFNKSYKTSKVLKLSVKMSRSIVWNYFCVNDEDKTVRCITCNLEVKRDGGNTSNLRRHLQTKHKQLYADFVKLENVKAANDEASDAVGSLWLTHYSLFMFHISFQYNYIKLQS